MSDVFRVFEVACRVSYVKPLIRSEVLDFKEWKQCCLTEMVMQFGDFKGFGNWTASKGWVFEEAQGEEEGYFEYTIALKRDDLFAFHEKGEERLEELGEFDLSSRIRMVLDKEEFRRMLNIFFPDCEGWEYQWGGIDSVGSSKCKGAKWMTSKML